MNAIEKKIKKLVFGHYDMIYKNIQELAKRYAVKRLPLNLVDEILKRAILEPTPENQAVDTFIERANLVTNTLKTLIHEQSAVIGDNKVSIYEIKEMIQAIKEAFLEELKQSNESTGS